MKKHPKEAGYASLGCFSFIILSKCFLSVNDLSDLSDQILILSYKRRVII